MKSNMQIINVNAAIIMSCSYCDLVYFVYLSIVVNVNLYFIKLASDMLH